MKKIKNSACPIWEGFFGYFFFFGFSNTYVKCSNFFSNDPIHLKSSGKWSQWRDLSVSDVFAEKRIFRKKKFSSLKFYKKTRKKNSKFWDENVNFSEIFLIKSENLENGVKSFTLQKWTFLWKFQQKRFSKKKVRALFVQQGSKKWKF